MKQDPRIPRILLLSAMVLFAFGLILFGVKNVQANLSLEDTGAIFGGKLESGYATAGYLLALDDKVMTNCGMTILDEFTVITAAHCVRDKITGYLGFGSFDTIFSTKNQAAEMYINPLWDYTSSSNDMAIIRLTAPDVDHFNYSQIVHPIVGCDYEVIGYGLYEGQDKGNGSQEVLRKSTEICIEQTDSTLLYIKGKDGGICFGDSGSPIFRKGTNQLVGLLSAIVKTYLNPEGCSIENRGLAVRLDSQENFINGFNTTITAKNQNCDNGICYVKEGDFCSISQNLICDSGLTCVQKKCANSNSVNPNNVEYSSTNKEIVATPTNEELVNGVIQNYPYIIPLIGAIILLLAAIIAYLFKFTNKYEN